MYGVRFEYRQVYRYGRASGAGPEAYDRCVPTVDNAGGEVIYFPGPNGMVKYSVDNRFLGSVKMKRRSSLLMICDTTATQILVNRDSEGERCISYLRTDMHGNLTDSMVVV